MVGISYCISIANVKDFEEYKEILENIITLANREVTIISKGGISDWYLVQLESIVLPEMGELLQYILKGYLFLKHGRQQRLLESTYILTDSLNAIAKTPLGIEITRLQVKINSQK